VPAYAGVGGTSWDVQGVHVAGTGPREQFPLNDEGPVGGHGIYLLVDGTFLDVAYTGTWHRGKLPGDTKMAWTGTATPRTAEEVIVKWGLQTVLEGIAKAFDRQAGRRDKATREAEARAERLAALARLI
jgi:hypothetical protein